MGFSPYEHGRQVGTSFGAARQEASDQGNIKNILAEAQASGDPQVLQNSIGRILSSVSKENQPAAINYLQNMMTTAQTKQQQQQQFAREKEQGLLPGAAPAVQVQALKASQQEKAMQDIFGNNATAGQPNQLQQPAGQLNQPVPTQPNQLSDDSITTTDGRQFNQKQIDQMIASPHENIRRLGESLNSQLTEQRKAKKEIGQTYGKEREKSLSKYIDESQVKADEAYRSKIAIDEIRTALKGNIAGPGLKAVVKNSEYGKLMFGLNPDETLLRTANKTLLEGSKGLFGPKPTEQEIFILLEDMLPSIGKSREANEVGLKFIERLNNLKILQGELIDQISEGGTKYVPDLRSQVNKALIPFGEKLKEDLQQESEKQQIAPVKMRLLDGRPVSIPASKVQAALNKGAKII